MEEVLPTSIGIIFTVSSILSLVLGYYPTHAWNSLAIADNGYLDNGYIYWLNYSQSYASIYNTMNITIYYQPGDPKIIKTSLADEFMYLAVTYILCLFAILMFSTSLIRIYYNCCRIEALLVV